MDEYLVYCPKCYGAMSVWPEEEADRVVKKPLKASANVEGDVVVICDVHGRMSWQQLLQEYGNG
jgi:hypothetical protein